MNRTRRWVIGTVVTGLVAVAAGLYWFQPWQLAVDKTVQEDLPAAAPQPAQSQKNNVDTPCSTLILRALKSRLRCNTAACFDPEETTD